MISHSSRCSTLAVELALVNSLELLLGWTFGGPDILGLRTWGEPLRDRQVIRETERSSERQRGHHRQLWTSACLYAWPETLRPAHLESSVIGCFRYLVWGAEVCDWLKGMGRTSLLLPLWLKTDFDWLILETDWGKDRYEEKERVTGEQTDSFR